MTTLLVATAGGLFRCEDGGQRLLWEGDVAALAVDGATVWAAVDGTVLVRGSADGGFAPVAEHPRALRCLVATGDTLLAGTVEAGLVRLDGDRLVDVAGFADVAGRDTWHTPWGGPPDTRSLAVGPDGAWYANVHVGGIPRSDDGGATWRPTIEVDADVHEVRVAGDLVLAATAYGLAVSADRGDTWHWRTEGLHARYARAVAVAADTVWLSVSDGPRGTRSAVYRGALAVDGPLRRCPEQAAGWFADNVDTDCLLACGDEAWAGDGSTIHRFDERARTWQALADGLPAVRALTALPSGAAT